MIFREVEDRDLIAQARRDNVEAYNLLVSRWEKRIYNYLLRLVKNREDALDAVQEAFVDAFRAIDKFDPSRRFYPWFYVLLRNRCFKMLAVSDRQNTVNLEELEILAPSNESSIEDTLTLEAENMIASGTTEDHRNAARAFVEKREPSFSGR